MTQFVSQSSVSSVGSLPSAFGDNNGFSYNCTYTGSIAVDTPMKSLGFTARTALAKECISMVCRDVGVINRHVQQPPDPTIVDLLGTCHSIQAAQQDVQLVIGTRQISVEDRQTGRALFRHPIQYVSFASGGENETADFVCYFGKSDSSSRRCYVFDCGVQQAAFLLASIGAAFKQPATSRMQPPSPSDSVVTYPPGGQGTTRINQPDPQQPPRRSPTGILSHHPRLPTLEERPTPENSGDSLDPMPATRSDHDDQPGGSRAPKAAERRTVPDVGDPWRSHNESTFANVAQHVWYHGELGRDATEKLLSDEGDFLVRRSPNSPHQLVLSGMQAGIVRHLFLLDDNGVVRTKDRTFDSVPHLIRHHMSNNIPITTPESSVLLRRGIPRPAATSV